MRFRFSIRTLITLVLFICLFLAVAIRFGPHILWKTIRARSVNDRPAVPTQLLVNEAFVDDLVACNIGAITFEIPADLADKFNIHRGIGGIFLNFYDLRSSRQAIVEIPTIRMKLATVGDIGNPSFSDLSLPRFQKKVVEKQHSDFSWAMTRSQLNDHVFLLQYQASIPNNTRLLEYLWEEDFEAILTHSDTPTFQWTSLDERMSGTVHFTPSSPEDTAWVRHFCATFTVDGSPIQFDELLDAEIKSLLKQTKVSKRNGTAGRLKK